MRAREGRVVAGLRRCADFLHTHKGSRDGNGATCPTCTSALSADAAASWLAACRRPQSPDGHESSSEMTGPESSGPS